MMKILNRFFQNYKQATWRTQIQWVGLFLACLVAVVIVLGFYLNITTRTALAGREIAYTQDDIITIQHEISDLEYQIASLSSIREMEKRAASLGFVPADPNVFTYIVVPGYLPKSNFTLAPKIVLAPQPIQLPEYRESLIDWFLNRGHQ
jgi:cell division protein FtsL